MEKLGIARGGKSNLTTHLATKRHREASKKLDKPLESEVKIDECPALDKVNEAELKLCAWAVEHNIPFAAVDKLADVLKGLTIEPKLLEKLTLGRTKTVSVIESVIASTQHDDLVRRMKNDDFSIIIDESTDQGNKKTLAIVVRMMDDDNNCAKDT